MKELTIEERYQIFLEKHVYFHEYEKNEKKKFSAKYFFLKKKNNNFFNDNGELYAHIWLDEMQIPRHK